MTEGDMHRIADTKILTQRGFDRMKERIVDYLIAEFDQLKPFQIEQTIQLLSEGCTIPFIARYRKEKTGEMDEVQIQSVRDRHQYLTEPKSGKRPPRDHRKGRQATPNSKTRSSNA